MENLIDTFREMNQSPCILLNKIINFNKIETELRMENLTDSFREMNLMLRLI